VSGFAIDTRNRLKTIFFYFLMVTASVAIFFMIRRFGDALPAPAAASSAGHAGAAVAQTSQSLVHVLLALVVVIVLARSVGALFRHLHQPPVIGEILAGLMLGPSLLGKLAPEAYAYLLPPAVAPYLGIISQVGVLLYMFLVGLELDTSLLRRGSHATVAISHASILVPFLLGSALALALYPILSPGGVTFTVFALFMGVSMSVTAFPVLARILTDRRIQKTEMGTTALACAAVDDVSAWCLLALIVSVVTAKMGSAFATVALTIGYIAFIFLAVRPLMVWFSRRYDEEERVPQSALAVVVVGLLLSGLATEYIGVHAIFGAFLFGAVIPHESRVARELTDRLQDLVVVLLLPAFFAFTGMRTQIGLVHGLGSWMICGSIILVASIGKFGGTLSAARLVGLGWREGSALGILMNTRGLMELIVLNIGLDLGVLSPTLFAMLVIMALVTTLATTPILHLITRGWISSGVTGQARAGNKPLHV
jgi:Kef-type K+ transport system membrane component KefB